MYQFKVKTSYALGGLAGGRDAMRTDWVRTGCTESFRMRSQTRWQRSEREKLRSDAKRHSSVLLSGLKGAVQGE